MKKFLVIILTLLLVIVGVNIFFYYKYFPGSTLEGVDVSWQTRHLERSEPIDKQLYLLSERGDIKEEVTPKGFFSHIFYLPNKELFTLKPLHLSWEKKLSYDTEELEKYLQATKERLPDNQEAKNASLSLKNGEVHLEPAKSAISLPDVKELLALVEEELNKESFEVSLDKYITPPEIASRDLRPEANKWRKASLLCKDYQWNLEGKNYLSLFNKDFTLDEKKAEKAFKEYFDKEDTGKTMWIVDQKESLPLFIKALKEKASTWEPSYIRVRRDPDPGYAMGDGIAVSVDRQWLWLYRGGNVVFQAPVITGNPNRGYATHRGYWSILSMATNTRLANTNREGVSYDVPVSYWMQINNEGMIEGIHDATWHWAFGTDHYLYDGSHGCINLHVDDMAYLYYQCWQGMPVWVY